MSVPWAATLGRSGTMAAHATNMCRPGNPHTLGAQREEGERRAAMTPTPTNPKPAAALPAEGRTHSRTLRQRPAGETGGHSVQDWEQPTPRQGMPAALGRPQAGADQPSVAPPAAEPQDDDVDSPSPPTVPRYLRSTVKTDDALPFPPAFDARRQTLTAQSAALVDSITRGVAEALAVSLRPVIASTVDALLPMILSLGSVPDPKPIPDAVAWDEGAVEGEAS
jgi:hypothetical protein